MLYVGILTENVIVSKAINYEDIVHSNEIELTEEQYNTIPIPCKLVSGEFVPCDFPEVDSEIIKKPLPITEGGTGATTAEEALMNLGALKTTLLWENASPTFNFSSQTITLLSADYDFLIILGIGQFENADDYKGSKICSIVHKDGGCFGGVYGIIESGGRVQTPYPQYIAWRQVTPNGKSVKFGNGYRNELGEAPNSNQYSSEYCIPHKIYGVKI